MFLFNLKINNMPDPEILKSVFGQPVPQTPLGKFNDRYFVYIIIGMVVIAGIIILITLNHGYTLPKQRTAPGNPPEEEEKSKEDLGE
jgi:hypothetical protein